MYEAGIYGPPVWPWSELILIRVGPRFLRYTRSWSESVLGLWNFSGPGPASESVLIRESLVRTMSIGRFDLSVISYHKRDKLWIQCLHTKTQLTVKKRRISIFLFKVWMMFLTNFMTRPLSKFKQKSSSKWFGHVDTGVNNLLTNYIEITKWWKKDWCTSHANKIRFVELFFMNSDDLFKI